MLKFILFTVNKKKKDYLFEVPSKTVADDILFF